MKPARVRLAKFPPAALPGRPLIAILLATLLAGGLAPALAAAPGARVPLALYPADGARGEAFSGAVLSEEGLQQYGDTFRYLLGETVDWKSILQAGA